MATLFLLSLYLTYGCMGLFGSLFGAVWPVAQLDFLISGSYGGIISICITGGSVMGSLLGAWVQKKIGSGKTAFFALASMAVLCFALSFSPHFIWFALLSIPIGFMSGTLDVTINNYMANNYPPQYISWLHSFWGVGTSAGAIIASYAISQAHWRWAYRWIAVFQIAVSVGLLLLLPQWKKGEQLPLEATELRESEDTGILKKKGVVPLLLAMFAYGGVEGSANYWGSSFLIEIHHFSQGDAAKWISLFFAGLMASRVLAGFIAMRRDYREILFFSQIILVMASVLLLFAKAIPLLLLGLFLLGFGCGPIAPATVQLAPQRFGSERSRQIIGFQSASLFLGTMLVPSFTGVVGSVISMISLPIVILIASVLLLLSNMYVERVVKPSF